MASAKNLTSPRVVTELLEKYDLRLTKAYGQHFLIDANIRRKIIEAARFKKDDVVLEVGPGIGTLSQEIAPNVRKLWLIELEKRFIPILGQALAGRKNIEIKQADAMKQNYAKLSPRPNKIVSNLPYNIAAPLIINLLQKYPFISDYVLMIQDEMASRLTGKPSTKEYGALSVKIAYLAEIKYLFKVSNQVFLPKPKVASAVISLKRYRNKPVDTSLFKLIESAFAYRRKTIKSALALGGYEKEKIDKALGKAAIESNKRAEALSLKHFQSIAKYLNNH